MARGVFQATLPKGTSRSERRMRLATLRNAFRPGDFQSGNRDTSENTCKSSASSCEMVEVPSRKVTDPKSVDLTIVRPMVGGPPGGTVTVKITLAKK